MKHAACTVHTTVSSLLDYLTWNRPNTGREPQSVPREALHSFDIAWLHMLLSSNNEYASQSRGLHATLQ